MTRAPLTILFSGMIAADPYQGGATWAVLQYLLGLRRLGHEVYLIEPVMLPALLPAGATLEGSLNAAYFREVMDDFGLADRSALLVECDKSTVGLPYSRLLTLARQADVLINVSGMLTDPDLLGLIPIRAYLDLDPAFVQMWDAVQGVDMRFASHTHFVTVGQAIGTPTCAVPTCGRAWLPTFQPIVLDYWPRLGPEAPLIWNAWTTIANWRGYGSITHAGVVFGQKAHSLRRLISLPELTVEPLAPAIAIHPAEVKDWEALTSHGWHILDPKEVASTPNDYRSFVQQSKGEFGLAKSGYVASGCGWFSDRSTCYLASGRPVVAQETGFSTFLPVGEGLVAFETAEQAAGGLDAVGRNYARHCRAARAIAEDYFDSDKVLNRLLQRIGAEP